MCFSLVPEELNSKESEEPDRHVAGGSSEQEDGGLPDEDPLVVRDGENVINWDWIHPLDEAKQRSNQECSAALPGAGATLT